MAELKNIQKVSLDANDVSYSVIVEHFSYFVIDVIKVTKILFNNVIEIPIIIEIMLTLKSSLFNS